MTEKYSVVLIGAGSMGGSMLKGWLGACLLDPDRSAVVDPNLSDALAKDAESYGLAVNPATDLSYEICVLAVKPQLFPVVIPALSWPAIENTLFVSIAAGKSIASIDRHLKEAGVESASIIRVMPNLPVSVGKGLSLLYADENVDAANKTRAEKLVKATGQAVWMRSEREIDAGMSVSACGPAYAFLLTEAMEEAGIAAGLAPETAALLARQTVIGAGALMAADTRAAATLRTAVTSKGGTTAEALNVLDQAGGMRELMVQAVAAATRRAGELSD
ncbi:MAG: pyrroline-5-carboxylate reductase [Aquisalinus sp.]|nr:pyrroline-5-carboxylate reductase [Aquisalinus sp.]